MQPRDVVATRLRPAVRLPRPAHLVWLPPETFREALRIGLERRYVGKRFAFGWLAPDFAWCGMASVLVGGARLLLG